MSLETHYPRGHHPASRKKPGQLCSRDRRCKTECVGVSFTTINEPRARGHKPRRYFQALAGRTKRKFCIDALGREEAFRRAVAFRAQYELRVGAEKEKGAIAQ